MQSVELETPGTGQGEGLATGPDFFLDLDHNQSLFRELLQAAPRGLMAVQAELLFLDGQLVYHWRDPQEKGSGEHFKFVSPQQAARAFQQQAVDTGWLPQGLVRWGSTTAGNWLVKFIAPTYHTIILTMLNAEHFKQLGEVKKDLVQITVPMPALIFAGSGSHYYVWAMKGQMLDPEGKLYKAPLPNLYDDGRVCFGSNKPPEASWSTLDKVWKLFIEDAPFNADLIQSKSEKNKTDIRKQLIWISKKVEKSVAAGSPGSMPPYPVEDLMPHNGNWPGGMTLNKAIDQYLISK